MADLNALRAILANGGADLPTLNAIRQLLDSGTPMPGNAGGATASFDAPNAMRDALDSQQGPPADMSEFGIRDSQRPLTGGQFGSLDHEQQAYSDHPITPQEKLLNDALAAQSGDQGAYARIQSAIQGPSAQPSTQDLRKQGANFVRNEDTGQTIYLGPNGQASDRPTYASQPASVRAQAPQMMQVIGSGNGTRVNLPPEQAPDKVNLDYSRPALQVMGGANAIYSKDEPGVAYVLGPDGRPKTKVMLGYDLQGSMALNKANAEMAQTQAQTEHTQEETRASRANNPDLTGNGGSGPRVNMSLSGDDFLQQLDPNVANEVKALGDGKTPFNPRSQRQLNLLGLVQAYNPSWSATDYQQKQATVKSFSPGGIEGQKVQQVNQALHHAGLLLDTIGQLGNSDTLPGLINPVKNTLGPMLNGADTAPGVYKETADALASEVRKVYAGSGGGTEGELRDWQASFNPNASQTQQRAYLKRGMDLLQGGIQALKSSYERGMGPSAKFGDLLDSHAREGLSKILQGGVDPGISALVGSSGGAPSTQPISDPAMKSKALFDARSAIARGAPRDQVLARLRSAGITQEP